jgi:hypothetical protein
MPQRRQIRSCRQDGEGFASFIKGATKAVKSVAKNPIVKGIMRDIVLPMVQAKISKKMGGKGLRLAGSGLRLAGEGKRRKAAKRPALKKQLVYY